MSKSKKDEINWDKEIALAQIQIQTLERQLLMLSRENADYNEQIKQLQAVLKREDAGMEHIRADKYDMVQEMSRQFKQMQEELTRDISEREKQIENIRTQNAKDKESLQAEKAEKERQILLKDEEVTGLKRRLDQLSREFSAILRETLAQIADKIEHKNDDFA